MISNTIINKDARTRVVPNGKIINLDSRSSEDLQFVREAYGYGAEEKGWFRERNRLFAFSGALTPKSANSKLSDAAPSGILEVPMPAKPAGPVSQRLLTMDDGTVMRWIRHPSVLPKSSQSHWRGHSALFELKGKNPDFVCYTSIPSFAVVDGVDDKYRFWGPGGICWIDYPNPAVKSRCPDQRRTGQQSFPDQINGPWLFHDAGLSVVPYEGIGAGGVTGVAYSVMTRIFGKCPFTISSKIKLIKDYVGKVLR